MTSSHTKSMIVKLYNAGLNGTEIFTCLKKGFELAVSKATVYRVIKEVNQQRTS